MILSEGDGMPLDDVELIRSSAPSPEYAFALRVEGDPCYGEECTGCCGSGWTNLSREELESLRERIVDLLDPTRHDPQMTQAEYLARPGG